jgi:transposase-like protein
MALGRRKFDEDFKQGAVRLVRETGKPIAQVARELGVNEGTLGNWCGQDRRRRGEGALSEDEREELRRLRKENAELRMRCDVLKRSAAQRGEHGIPHATACRALGVSPAWFYKWRDGDGSPRRARKEQLGIAIRQLFAARHGKYGSPRITDDLREAGWRVSEKTVAAIMREQRLVARPKKRRKQARQTGWSQFVQPVMLGLSGRAIRCGRLSPRWPRPVPTIPAGSCVPRRAGRGGAG